MFAWVKEDVPSPYGTIPTLNWAYTDDESQQAATVAGDYDDLEPAQDQLGSVLWNSNTAVLNYLEEEFVGNGRLRGKVIVELGAGVGCVGIGLAAGGAKSFITDIKELVPLMRRNIALSSGRILRSPGGQCVAGAWRWGEDPPIGFSTFMQGAKRAVDYVVMVDALYGNPKEWPKLIRTLDYIALEGSSRERRSQSNAKGLSTHTANEDGPPALALRVVNFCEQRVEDHEDAFLKVLTISNEEKKNNNTTETVSWSFEVKKIEAKSNLSMPIRVTVLVPTVLTRTAEGRQTALAAPRSVPEKKRERGAPSSSLLSSVEDEGKRQKKRPRRE